jgi:SulP family sulfate permease
MAGLTVATVAVPQAMAYATLAGVPPQYGLYTAIVMTAVGALLDSSRQLINGPTNAISIALLSGLAVIPEDERMSAAVLLAFLVGLTQLGIALLRLGDLTRYVSPSVIVGFTVGAGTLLVLDQMKNFFGWEARGDAEDHFLKRFWLSMTSGGGIHWPTFLIGVATIGVVLAVRQFNSFCRKRGARFPIPQHLVAVIIMSGIVWALSLDRVKIVGPIPAALPSFQPPALKWEQIRLMAGSTFAIAVLGLLEAVAMAKSIASRTGQKLDINQQCLSEGAANLAGSFFQCIPGSGSLTRSAVNQQAGAVSQWSGVFSAVGVAAMVLLFAPFAQFIPRASLAGLLMLAAFRMVDRKQLIFHLRATRLDAGVVLVTALAAILISVEFCIVIGVFLSFVLYVPRAAQVRMVQLTLTREQRIRERLVADPPCDRLLLYGLEGELFFGAEPELDKHFVVIEQASGGKAGSQGSGIRNQTSGIGSQESVKGSDELKVMSDESPLEEDQAQVRPGESSLLPHHSSLITPHTSLITHDSSLITHHSRKVRAVVLVLHRARNPDAAFLNLLEDFNAHLRQGEIALILAGVQPDLSRALTNTGLDGRIGIRQIFCDPKKGNSQEASATSIPGQGSSTWDAVHFAYDLLGGNLCITCPRRKETPPTDRTVDYVI